MKYADYFDNYYGGVRLANLYWCLVTFLWLIIGTFFKFQGLFPVVGINIAIVLMSMIARSDADPDSWQFKNWVKDLSDAYRSPIKMSEMGFNNVIYTAFILNLILGAISLGLYTFQPEILNYYSFLFIIGYTLWWILMNIFFIGAMKLYTHLSAFFKQIFP